MSRGRVGMPRRDVLRKKTEYGCAFGECPSSNLSENEIVNEDGATTSDAESQETLVADDETDSSLRFFNEAEIDEGVEEGMAEADGKDGNYKEEVISGSTIDEMNVLGTADKEVESGEESEEEDELSAESAAEEDQMPSESDEEEQLPSSESEPSSAEAADSGKDGTKDEESLPSNTSSYYPNNDRHRSAWVAHIDRFLGRWPVGAHSDVLRPVS